jgi:hypothetical protein
MRTTALLAAVALAAVCSSASLQAAAQEATALEAAQATDQAASPAVDPAAIQALERMAAFLRSLQSFEARTRTTYEDITVEEGQKLTFSGAGLYRVRRPNAFFVEQRTDRRQRQYFYDGATLTVYSPRMHYYAQVAAPATIAETVTMMEDRYNLDLPLTDLFTWGTSAADTENITSAQHIGFARVNDIASDQYAFRQGALDWQVWIQRGDQPLPLKVVITSRELEGQPSFSSELTWTLNPTLNNAVFVFTPDADARRIVIAANEE